MVNVTFCRVSIIQYNKHVVKIRVSISENGAAANIGCVSIKSN